MIRLVREREAEYRAKRLKEGKSVLGAEKLRLQPYMKPHSPKKRERKIFLVCHNRKRRKKLLYLYRMLFARLRDCYEAVKDGKDVVWPPGTFTPWCGPTECYCFSSS